MTFFVQVCIILTRLLTIDSRGNDSNRLHLLQELNQIDIIVGLIADSESKGKTINQVFCLRSIMAVASSQKKSKRIP